MSDEPYGPGERAERRRRRRARRRRRGETGRRRGVYFLPQLFTTANLFFGFFTIVQAQAGHYDRAALGIVLAGVCDALDGRIARLARATSRFGSEYDSLADVVSFGLAPALLAFHAGHLEGFRRTGLAIAFLYVVCAALRLARFNVSPSRYRGRFEGLPSPAAAGMIASTQWFVSFLRENEVPVAVPEPLVAAGVAAVGLLMVSAIPYRSFKEVDLRHSYRGIVAMVVALIVIVQEPSVSFFAIGALYVASGPVEWLWRRASGRPLEEVPPPVSPEARPEASA
ncbi:MAG: CDP-diacylglycerol--serine O-phosphatidyltransferase [Proteobacteria bacterium]|nr:MAG: CDP-diacylglycerol--serine O-phosphatidyltransferase [Pseudomonadota bacterium]